jgi:enamine deaminase RidA (YjgF/YER057c/UK114 family)
VSVQRLASGGPWEDVVGCARAVVVPAGAARVLVSGCTAVVDGAPVHPGDAQAQALTALDHALEAVRRAGGRPEDVVRTRAYVVGPEHCDAVGRAHAQRLGAVRPAATMVCVAALVHPALLVEVEVEAALPQVP